MRPPVGAPTLTRRTRILLAVAGVLVLLLLGGSRLINFYIDWLWFGEVGFRGVFTTILFTRIVQFLAGGLLIGGLVALALWIAYRSRPVFVPLSGPEDPIARYRTVIIQRLRLFAIGIPVAVGLIAGLAAQGDWQIVQQFLNSTPFGIADPEFGLDVSFYAFQLPFYRLLLNWLFVGVAISFVVALVTHYIFGGIRLTGRGGQVSGAARAQLAVLAGVFVLLKAVAYWLDRYELLFSDRNPLFNGATYTDLNAVMPAKLILLFISLICAAAFFVAVFRNNLQLPAIATVLLVLSSVLVGAAWPAILQQFVVAPNAQAREAVSIERNIAATRDAYGLTDATVTEVPYSGESEATPAEVRAETATIPNIRILDPAQLTDTFTQLQQRRTFYGFPETLDIDRYRGTDGTMQDYIVGLRELRTAGLAGNQTDWINQQLVYTHGNGIVVAPANQVNAALDDAGGEGGLPRFTSIDTTNSMSEALPESLRVEQPRTYYGELIQGYSIVGAPEGAPPVEYDSDTQQYTYDGKGGVPLDNIVNRLAFSAYYGERNILFNNSINENSKIMYVRDPADRVELVAPWLTVDGDPYPSVVDGRITWIVDGYTSLDNYPYAERTQLGEATADTLAGGPGVRPELNREVSYLRNSVKATVDAYDGTVTLYAFDESDPVLQTWMKTFPDTVQPSSAISPSLREHVRYPEDLFKVQRDLLTSYHVDNPGEFFSNVSFWEVPSDPTPAGGGAGGLAQPPYYLLAGQPGGQASGDPSFQLTSALVFQNRDILSAYMSASSDPGTYGQITLLQLPPDTQELGPQQVQSRFVGTPVVSQELGLLARNGQSSVINGNLLTLPVAGGLLYVEPVYIQRANEDSSYPQLARVLVSYNGRVGFAPDLATALDQVFGAGAAADVPTTPGTVAPDPGTAVPNTGAGATPELAAAAAGIQTAITNLKAAQQSGDFAAQGTALAALDAAVQQFQAAQAAQPAG
ncbi:UPF0182 family protein [Pseudonocardia abyssalis]|uniref:UPF0182 protein I4I81_19075 n=1 Tax=Pseudonocardia abyssalis TaxID=2792008 RepID=A0ABS6UVZ9_9PSEU|nr:UPF0182 family protein [Pseudonocardia abyssalis]MBW0114864.1 UPF0182 family protein [Pseudonocardia abyssalis]MBW0136352.1 UPF0182 family protein [Pseudonocardia abyssalis]